VLRAGVSSPPGEWKHLDLICHTCLWSLGMADLGIKWLRLALNGTFWLLWCSQLFLTHMRLSDLIN